MSGDTGPSAASQAAAPQPAPPQPATEAAARAEESGSPFRNPRFLALWIAQGVSQTVNTGLQFVLLILVVEKTDLNIAASGLIIALAAPPVVFGLVSGVLVDRWEKRRVMQVTNLLRAGCTALLVFGDGSLGSIYALTFLTATMGQFFLVAASASIPALVPRSQLLSANSAFQLTVLLSQFLGMVLVAPLMLKVFGFTPSYVVGALLILATLPLIDRLPALPPHLDFGRETWRDRLRAVPVDLRAAWRVVRRDNLTTLALIQLSTGGLLLFMFALLVPRFVQEVLEIDADNSAFVFAPTGVGALVALRFLPALGRRYTPSAIVTAALFGLTGAIAAFGSIHFLVDFLQEKQPWGALGPDQVGGVSLLVFITLVAAFPLGLAYALVNAPAQTVLHERAPADMRGRIIATQLMVANGASMAALLVVGGVTDAIGVEWVMFVVAGMTGVVAWVSVYFRHRAARAGELAQRPNGPAEGGAWTAPGP